MSRGHASGDGTPDERRRLLLRLLTAFVVGFATLTLEIAYTRVISFKLFYYYTYFVIGLALLGLGAASAVTALSARMRSLSTPRLVQAVGPAAALVGLVSYAVVARLPTNTIAIWTGSKAAALRQLAVLFGLSVSLTAVFFAAGLLLASLIVVEVEHVRRLYFWDLAGAALGCLLAVPLQAAVGPPAMILIALVLLAALGVAAAIVEQRRVMPLAALLGVVVIGAIGVSALNIRPDELKGIGDDYVTEASEWGPVFRVDVLDFDALNGHQILVHDGQWGSTIWRYDGTPATTARLATDSRQIPFAAFSGEAPRVLIIGAAGGNEIQAALTYGAGHIDAVELNPVTVDLLRGKFADYSGNIATNPIVNYVQGDGRTFLARSDNEYDIVWFVAPDSYAASNAASSGAFVLSESYLYTQEMIETAFDHLTPTGMVVAQFGENEYDRRPIRTPRYLVTARKALQDRVDRFADHAGLIVESSPDFALSRTSTILLFRQSIDTAAVQRIEGAVAKVPPARTVYLPGGPEEASMSTFLITQDDTVVQSIIDGYEFDISAIDDDRPFFWHFTPYSDVLTNYHRGYQDSEIAIGERLLVLLLVLAVAVAAVALFLPFAVTRRRRGAVHLPQRWRFFVYFACLGVGFMFVEISMIQRFALLLGYPTLSLSVSLFTLLIATAVGARFSWLAARFGGRGPLTAAVVLVAVTLLYLAIARPLTDSALSWPQPARMLLVFLLLAPVGLMLGVFLPTGMDALVAANDAAGAERGRNVAWCWAVNGFFSVMGSTLTTIVSMSIGFNRTVLFGLALYVVASLVLGTARAVGRVAG